MSDSAVGHLGSGLRVRWASLFLAFSVVLVVGALSTAEAFGAIITERVSVGPSGVQADSRSSYGTISANGRYVAFISYASNLVAGDLNGYGDVVVYDRTDMVSSLVSVSSAEVQGNAHAQEGHISMSYDGRYVAFSSYASNLVTGDTNSKPDVFVRDTVAGTTERISVSSDEVQADGASYAPSISADGRYVAFFSGATNLVLDDSNMTMDVFVRDRTAGTTYRVSVTSAGAQCNGESTDVALSADGEYVVFQSSATNLVPGDTNGLNDVFRRNWQAGSSAVTERVSVSTAGTQADAACNIPAISADGRYVVFLSVSSLLVGDDTNGQMDVFLRDCVLDTTERVSLTDGDAQANAGSYNPSISDDGSRVAFLSEATNLVTGDTNATGDIFVRDLTTDATTRMSVSSAGAEHTGSDTNWPAIAPGGRHVAYQSGGSELVTGDTNSVTDIFCSGALANRAPVAVADSYQATRETELEVAADGVLANDTDADLDALIAVLVSQPAHGTLDLNGDGSFSYTPDDWFVGTDSFTYRAEEGFGGASNTTTVKITVTWDDLEDGSERVAGTDRYLTSVQASQARFSSANTVVIATGANWPDALGGSALAGAVEGPLLLTKPDSLPSAVSNEITRLKAKKAYILGGTGAVSANVESALVAKLGRANVVRLAGTDRYGTAKAIADEVIKIAGKGYSGDALVATGADFPDATGASPLAASLVRPILLVKPSTGAVYVPSATDRVIILGGEGAVSSAVESSLESKLGTANVVRKGGANRYATAALVAQAGVDAGMRWDGVGIATGANFPDALAGGAMLGANDSVMLLTKPDSLHSEAKVKLSANKASIDTLYIIGGDLAVSPAAMEAAETAAGL